MCKWFIGNMSLTILFVDHNKEDSPNFSYKDMINRDERRWKAADKNNDGQLDKAEFSDFLHPEEAEHMRDIVVQVFKIDGCHSNRNIFKLLVIPV